MQKLFQIGLYKMKYSYMQNYSESVLSDTQESNTNLQCTKDPCL